MIHATTAGWRAARSSALQEGHPEQPLDRYRSMTHPEGEFSCRRADWVRRFTHRSSACSQCPPCLDLGLRVKHGVGVVEEGLGAVLELVPHDDVDAVM